MVTEFFGLYLEDLSAFSIPNHYEVSYHTGVKNGSIYV